MMQLLLVEDSERLRRSLTDGLRRAGHDVESAADGEHGLHLALTRRYDVILLDVMLPKLDGLSLLRRLREAGSPVAVLLLTARDTVADRVVGLRGGADDYLVKPFAFAELLARVEALTRRPRDVAAAPLVCVSDLVINTAAKTVQRAGSPIPLAPREYALLELLAIRRGQVVSRAQIEAQLYDPNIELASNAVDSAVCALRRRIDPPGGPSLIHTRRGMGYLLQEPGS
jgi:DNA-binding response OmpR family regulator